MEKESKSTFFKNKTKNIISIIDGILMDSMISKNTIRVALLVLDNFYNLQKDHVKSYFGKKTTY